eukprot:snap_masked-scaffold_97-processed-gene-0.21-mRNA-1 protein AED:1.00 eAED:1.00 QI:0/0/0/0/1/1/2/0/103
MFSLNTSAFAFMWVIHAYEQQFRSLVIELGYKIKVSEQGSLLSCIGSHLNGAKKTCLIIAVGGVSALQTKSNFGVDVIFPRRREQSKSQMSYIYVSREPFHKK